MQSPQELLLALGITLSEYGPGIYQTTCPKCSANRQKRLAKCCTVRIQPDKVYGGCNHCGWTFPEPGSSSKESRSDVSYFIYRDVDGAARFRKVKTRDKKFWIEKPDGNGGWVKGAAAVDTSILYRIDEIVRLLQEHPATLIAIVEGEKDADNLWRIGIPATCNAHGASEAGKRAKWTAKQSRQLGAARLCVFNDNDQAGYEHAKAVLECSTGISQEIRCLDLKEHWPEIPPHGDVSDWLATGNKLAELIELMAHAPIKANGKLSDHAPDPTNAEVDRLARLSLIEYGQQREAAAEKLGIKAIRFLDDTVAHKRKQMRPDQDRMQGRSLEYEEPEPWLEEIHTEHLLNELVRQVKRFVVTPQHAPEIAALWVVHTWCLEATDVTPRLRIRAPERECGKSTLLDLLGELVYRPTISSNLTTASMFRTVEKYHPTLLIDEADSFAREDNDVRNVLNSGHHIRGYVLRVEGDSREVRRFATFAPLAYAHLGDLSSLYATLISRSIEIVLQRRLPTEPIESFSEARRRNEFTELRRKLKRFAVDHVAELAKAQPAYPERVTNDRQRDNWRPLLAVADRAGPDWGERARRAIEMPKGTASIREMMIEDIFELYARNEVVDQDGFVFGSVLAGELAKLDDRPWGEWGKQRKEITSKGVGKLLSVFDILMRMNSAGTGRGYYRADFEKVFARYRAIGSTPLSKAQTVVFGVNPLTKQQTILQSQTVVQTVVPGQTVVPDDLAGFAEASDTPHETPENPKNVPADDDVPFF